MTNEIRASQRVLWRQLNQRPHATAGRALGPGSCPRGEDGRRRRHRETVRWTKRDAQCRLTELASAYEQATDSHTRRPQVQDQALPRVA